MLEQDVGLIHRAPLALCLDGGARDARQHALAPVGHCDVRPNRIPSSGVLSPRKACRLRYAQQGVGGRVCHQSKFLLAPGFLCSTGSLAPDARLSLAQSR